MCDVNIPAAHSYCTGADTAPWVGFGGDAGHSNIIQGGSDSVNGSPSTYSLWWEDYPLQSYDVTEVPVSPGNRAYVDVYYNENQTATFYYENESTGTYTTFTKGTSSVSVTPADYVVEEYPPNYVQFGTVTFQETYEAGHWGSNYAISGDITRFGKTKVNMVDGGGTTRAWPDDPGSVAGGFHVYSQQSGC